MAGRVFDRTADVAASLTNHFLLDDEPRDARLSRIDGPPTLVIHGTADPLFPLAHAPWPTRSPTRD